jgi:hypothetical protein
MTNDAPLRGCMTRLRLMTKGREAGVHASSMARSAEVISEAGHSS